MNPVKTLGTLGQSVWLDYIRRGLLENGDFQRLIDQDGVSGVTSNPAIFQKAIADSDDYDSAIGQLSGNDDLSNESIYEHLAIEDVRHAADRLRSVYEATDGRDGFVSLEVSPLLANDTRGTIEAARRLWKAVERPNLMIKVPATPEGLPAVEELIACGLNVNITLLFSLTTYEKVAKAYQRGLQRRLTGGHKLEKPASVASFFLSRIDSAVDKLIDQRLETESTPEVRALLEITRGQVAVASARLAYQKWKELFDGVHWHNLEAAGARPQKLLWASTSTKNPDYPDLMYVESLIGPETINTIPPSTLDALREHGKPQTSLEDDLDVAKQILKNLVQLDIDLKQITSTLLDEGLEKFDAAYNKLLDAVANERNKAAA